MSINNSTHLIGNLGADPILRYSGSGTAVCNMSLAIDRTFNKTHPDGTREKIKTTDWIPVTCWGSQAENCARWLRKGSLVGVEGEIRPRQYEDTNGVTHRVCEVRANDVGFLGNIRSRDEVTAREAQAAQVAV